MRILNVCLARLVQLLILATATMPFLAPPSFGQEVSQGTIHTSYSRALMEIGERVTLTYTIDNSSGTTDLNSLTFTDDIPAQLEQAPGATLDTTGCVRNFSANAAVSSGVLTFTYSGFAAPGFQLAPVGQTCLVSMDFIAVAAGVGNTTVQVAPEFAVDIGDVGSITVDDEVSIATETIGLSKEFINDPVSAGGTTTLQFTAFNVHPFANATGLAFTDDLDAMISGASFESSSLQSTCGGAVSGSSVVEFSGGTILARSSCTISVDVLVPAGAAAGLYENSSSIASAMLDGDVVTSNVAQDRLEVTAAPLPMVVSQTITGDLLPDGSLILNFNISNPNATEAENVSLTEFYQAQLPNLTFNSVSGSCGAGASISSQFAVPSGSFDPAPAIVLNGGTIPASSSCSFSATFTLPSSYSSGTYDFTIEEIAATVDGASTSSADVTTSVLLESAINLTLAKAFVSDVVAAGGSVGLTFTLTNSNELNSATDVAFSDDLESFLTGTVLSSSINDSCGGAFTGTSVASYSGGTVPANGSCTIETIISVDAGAPTGVVENTTSDLTAGIDGGAPSVLSNTNASDTIRVLSQSAPTFTAEVTPSVVRGGSTATITYTIDNTQTGNGEIASLTLVDQISGNLPGSTTAMALSSDTCNFTVGLSGGQLFLIDGSIAADATCSSSISLNIGSGIPDGDYFLTPDLTASFGGGSLTQSGSAPVTVQTTFLSLSKSFDQSTINAGDSVDLAFTILNESETVAVTDIGFSDDLEAFLAGTTATNVVSNTCGGTVDISTSSSLINFTGGSILPSAQCEITVTLMTNASTTASTYTNVTSQLFGLVSAQESEVFADAASADLTVTQIIQPSFDISFSPTTILVGATTELTYSLGNPSSSMTLSDMQFSDDLDAFLSGTTIASIDATGCNGSISGQGSGTLLASGISIDPLTECVIKIGLQTGAEPAGTYLNTTSDIFQNGVKVADSAGADLITQNAPPTFSKAFSVAAIPQGGTTTLTFTLSNSAMPLDATGVSFTDAFPAGLSISAPANATTTCPGGTLTATAASDVVSYSGGTIVANGSCTISVDVTSDIVGAKVNTTGDLTSAFGNSGTATDTLTIEPAPVPTFAKAFGVDSMPQGDVTTLTLTLSNAEALIDATEAEFLDSFPPTLVLATPSNAVSTCTGGTLTATAGATSISYAGGTIPAGTSCTISANVTSVVAGNKVNQTGPLTSSLGNSGAATDTLTISPAPTPTFTKAFGVSAMVQGDVTSLTFDLSNEAALIDATSVNFVDSFPAGLVVATPNDASTTCVGGTLTATAGSGQLSYSGGTIPAGDTCTVSVNVTSASIGNLVNVTSDMTSNLGNSGTATDTLNITPAPVPTFAKEFAVSSMVQGDTTTLTLTLDNTAALVDATSVAFNDAFPTDLLVATPANASTNCAGGTLTAEQGSGSVSYSGGTIGAGASCRVTVDVISSRVGDRVNVTGDLTSDLGNSGTATDTLTITPAPTPNFAKEFSVPSIEQGDIAQLTLTLSNNGSLVAATDVNFTDTFPTGLTIASPSNVVSTCTGGTVTATAGSNSISYTNGTVPAAQDCSVTVDVTSIVVDSLVNVTGSLTSSLGDSGTATDTLEVTAAPIPDFSKAFADTSMVQGDVTQLTLTMSNADALLDATAVNFIDDFPVGLVVATPANATSTCAGGTVTAVPGAASVSFAGGTIPAGATCSVSVDVTSVAVGDLVNVTGEMTSYLGNSGTATATLEMTPAPVPTFGKAFSARQMTQGDIATLTLTLENTQALIDAKDISMVDTFPTGMTVASPANASTTCTGGTLTANEGAPAISFVGGAIGAGENCTVTVDISSATVGEAINVTDPLITSLGDSGTATATLEIIAAPLPSFAKSFAPSTVIEGGTSTMSFEINSAAYISASAVSFRDAMPAGMIVADVPNITNTCGGSVSANSGSGLVGLSAGSLEAQASCVVTVDVVGTAEGELVNVTDDLTSSLGNSGTASGTLTVTPRTTGTLTIVQVSDEDGMFSFTSSETSLNFDIATVSGAGSFGPTELQPGAYTITQSRPARFTNVGLECTDNDSIGTVSDGVLNVNLDAGEDVTCTYVTVNSGVLSETINDFLDRRITLMLSSEPSPTRRLNRLRQGLSGSRDVSFARGDLKSLLPFTLDTASLTQGNIAFSTSLSQARDALARQELSLDGSTTRTSKVGNERTDLWFEFQHKRYSDADGIDGKFSIGYVGFDYLLSPDVLVGGILQFDRTSESSSILSTSVEGNGFMVGPYVTARLSPTLFFDGRIAFGKSSNTASTGLIGPTDFKTNRFLVDASLIGAFKWNNWNVQPNASLSYMQEIWSIDPATGLTGEKVSQGQLKVGPQFSTSFSNDAGIVFQPSFGFDGIFVFGDPGSTGTQSHVEGLRGRVQAGIGVTYRNGTTFEFKANYDGIGQDDFESYGALINFSIPFNKK